MPPRTKRAGTSKRPVSKKKKQRIVSPSPPSSVTLATPPSSPTTKGVDQEAKQDELRLSDLTDSGSESDLADFIVPDDDSDLKSESGASKRTGWDSAHEGEGELLELEAEEAGDESEGEGELVEGEGEGEDVATMSEGEMVEGEGANIANMSEGEMVEGEDPGEVTGADNGEASVGAPVGAVTQAPESNASSPPAIVEPGTLATTPAGHPQEDTNGVDDGTLFMQECVGVTTEGGQGKAVLTADLSRAVPTDEGARQRILRIVENEGHPEAALNLARQPAGRLVHNLARVRQVATTDRKYRAALLSLAGIVTYNGLVRDNEGEEDDHPKQVCLAPFKNSFPRALANCRQVFGTRYLFMNSYRTGISFSTGRFRNTRIGNGKPTFQPLLPRNVKIPVYDARTKEFRWKKYHTLPTLEEDQLQIGMPCIVLFTLGKYDMKADKPGINTQTVQYAASLNLQSVIILRDSDGGIRGNAIGNFELDYSGIQRDPDLALANALAEPLLVPVVAPQEVAAPQVSEDNSSDDGELL
ncbi:hypothetical protein PENSPDRAFT_667022 [Peniophora sp. CONT]|nr:hypothetical protein PENSPDRAFT_667022 [Peniophora sp. CONT]